MNWIKAVVIIVVSEGRVKLIDSECVVWKVPGAWSWCLCREVSFGEGGSKLFRGLAGNEDGVYARIDASDGAKELDSRRQSNRVSRRIVTTLTRYGLKHCT